MKNPAELLEFLADKAASSNCVSFGFGDNWWKTQLNKHDRMILAAALRHAAKTQCFAYLDDYGRPNLCTAAPGHEGAHVFGRQS